MRFLFVLFNFTLVFTYIVQSFRLYAHKTGTGNTKNGRDSAPNFLGWKRTCNSYVYPGNVIIRQRGAKFKPDYGTIMGRDFTISAVRPGVVRVHHGKISVIDKEEALEELKKDEPMIATISKIWNS
ncbi:50S ribosomal protein L27 [Babesia microti strain RI]|uniref:50S ribosomal protein L27 n=1 Tax=Babesia microti (strain RI) TaxID=1133968 RepID=I7I9V9_BABMR|nr:50S ribosomal protein L27 [Babesia microti strain RI]CCF75719.1 50S ribosomal protein L27 [Babesia microti strain RI]|eukprot:XP_012650127.1 50S ribosomal protein L27 [Babesia microti strain RI]